MRFQMDSQKKFFNDIEKLDLSKFNFNIPYPIKMEDNNKKDQNNNKLIPPKRLKIETNKNKKNKFYTDDEDDNDVWSEIMPGSHLSPFDFLKTKIAGQDEALKDVSNVLLRGLTGLKNPDKPVGVLFFSGPTGVGKTETAKAIAEYVGAHFIRIDCGELSEYHTVSTILGSPPGYIGFEKTTPLLDLNEEIPVVLLFDEVEKAHRDLHMALLGAFDYGILTDRANRKIVFKRTLVILTSNTGAAEADKSSIGFFGDQEQSSESENRRKKAFSSSFPPEFRNRLTATINFKKLSKDTLGSVLDRVLEKLKNYPGIKKNNLDIVLDDSMRNFIIWLAEKENMGARPIERAIDKELIGPLADKMINNKDFISSSIVKFSRLGENTVIDIEQKNITELNSRPIKKEMDVNLDENNEVIKINTSKRGTLKYLFDIAKKTPFYVTVKNNHSSRKNKQNEGPINEGTSYEIIYAFKDDALYFVGRPVCPVDLPWEVLNGEFDFGFVVSDKPSHKYLSLNEVSAYYDKFPFTALLHAHTPDLSSSIDEEGTSYLSKKFEILYKKDNDHFVGDLDGEIFILKSDLKIWTIVANKNK